ncbi:MAG TPA: polysaccharide biosynthesis C-terminal domain-containing protein [Pyrinomonadaceae bacterium]|nr:polysaccharide biosynthesis C-terminal domain-containing protein [Pyrinomonadaceae bacterium]
MSTAIKNRANRTFGLPKTLHAFGVNVLLLPLGIVTSVLIARSIGPTGKGSFDLIVATSALLTMVLGVSLPPGVTFVVAQGKAAPKSLASQLIFVSLLQAVLAIIALAVLRFTNQIEVFLPNWNLWIVAGVAFYVWIEILTRFWAAILAGQQHIAIVNNAELIGRAAQFVSIFILYAVLYLSGRQLSVGLLFLVTLSAMTLINLILLASLGFKFQFSSDLSGLKATFAFALPCYAANVAQFLNYRLDVFVVGYLAGTASVGRYTLAVSLGQLLWLMSNSVATVLLPKVAASSDGDGNVRHTMQVTRLSLWATACCGVVLGLLATQAIPLFYGEPFRPSVMALLWLLPGIVIFSVANVLAAYIAGIGKPRLNLLVSGISLVITITLDLILIPKLNIVGAAMASTVSYSVTALLLVFFFSRETGAPLRQILLPTSEDLRMLLSLARLRLSSASTV